MCSDCIFSIDNAGTLLPVKIPGLRFVAIGGPFDGSLRELIHAYKYQGKDYLAPFLARICLRHWRINQAQVDVIVPVPLSLGKYWSRGYNQSQLLALELSRIWRKPVFPHALQRRLFTVSQIRLNQASRRINAESNFCLGRQSRKIHGKSVLLVDDVLTTGSTVSACAKLLKKAGARVILGGVIARET